MIISLAWDGPASLCVTSMQSRVSFATLPSCCDFLISWSTLLSVLRRKNHLFPVAWLVCRTPQLFLFTEKQSLTSESSIFVWGVCVCVVLFIFYLPSLRTNTRSLSMTVWILWAIVTIVRSLNSWLIIFCITPSVAESTDAVASSRTRMLLRLSKALPRQINCLCPTLQFSTIFDHWDNRFYFLWVENIYA